MHRLNQDQDRIRKNLANTPKEAEVYQTYLKKLADQEKEIDGLTAKQKKLMAEEFAAKKATRTTWRTCRIESMISRDPRLFLVAQAFLPNGTYFRFGITIEIRVFRPGDALWAPSGPGASPLE